MHNPESHDMIMCWFPQSLAENIRSNMSWIRVVHNAHMTGLVCKAIVHYCHAVFRQKVQIISMRSWSNMHPLPIFNLHIYWPGMPDYFWTSQSTLHHGPISPSPFFSQPNFSRTTYFDATTWNPWSEFPGACRARSSPSHGTGHLSQPQFLHSRAGTPL